jgi:hypothetical protein
VSEQTHWQSVVRSVNPGLQPFPGHPGLQTNVLANAFTETEAVLTLVLQKLSWSEIYFASVFPSLSMQYLVNESTFD